MLYLVESSFSPGELFWTGMEPVKAKYVVYIHRLTAGNFAESEKLVDDARARLFVRRLSSTIYVGFRSILNCRDASSTSSHLQTNFEIVVFSLCALYARFRDWNGDERYRRKPRFRRRRRRFFVLFFCSLYAVLPFD